MDEKLKKEKEAKKEQAKLERQEGGPAKHRRDVDAADKAADKTHDLMDKHPDEVEWFVTVANAGDRPEEFDWGMRPDPESEPETEVAKG